MLFWFIALLYQRIYDLAFPRRAGYRAKIKYEPRVYRALKENKIYCEHWGQINLETSVIVFLWKKDYEKALKLFPELQDLLIAEEFVK